MTHLTPDESSGWLRRFSFRLLAAYLVITNLSALLGLLPDTGFVSGLYTQLWQKIIPWAGKNLLQLSEPVAVNFNGSGDRMANWVSLWCEVMLSLAVALVWVWFDRARRHDASVQRWLRLGIRYVLGASMLGYGFAKLIPPMQFPPNGLARLVETYGDFSPMGVLWAFMGASTAYTFFSGFLEALAGFLLLFRRTTLLGAIFAGGVTLNIVMLNFCYDVPVKIYSTQLFFLALWLMWPDARRLVGLLILNRPVPAAPPEPAFERRWLRIGAVVLKVVVVGFLLYGVTAARWLADRKAPFFAKAELYGIWEVDTFTRDGETLPPLLTDKVRWRQVVVDYPRFIAVYQMKGGRPTRYLSTYDAGKKQIVLESGPSTDRKKYELACTRPTPDQLTIEGAFEGHQLSIRMSRVDETKFLLTSRGFHWVNETPFNR